MTGPAPSDPSPASGFAVSRPQRIVGLLLAAAAGGATMFFLPAPDFIRPTLAVIIFVVVCFFLGCPSLRVTIYFSLLVACVPIVAYTVGASNRFPLLESFRRALGNYWTQSRLMAVYLLAPLFFGGLVYGAMWYLRRVRRAQLALSDVDEP
jgi:uncharacterized membrane protein YciS (DUF1049 family)